MAWFFIHGTKPKSEIISFNIVSEFWRGPMTGGWGFPSEEMQASFHSFLFISSAGSNYSGWTPSQLDSFPTFFQGQTSAHLNITKSIQVTVEWGIPESQPWSKSFILTDSLRVTSFHLLPSPTKSVYFSEAHYLQPEVNRHTAALQIRQ